jgi:hypothetical protein
LGKLHNIVVHIRSSPQRQAEWEKLAERRIPLDNRTRWNSWYIMLDTVFEQSERQNWLDEYCSEYPDQLEKDSLSASEWAQLRTIHKHLLPFYEATLQAEGRTSSLDMILDSLDLCRFQLQAERVCTDIINKTRS